jgi:hypothetical protein
MATEFRDLMCDVECMGKADNAALLSIGAVFFDVSTCTLGPTFLQTIHLGSAVAHGGTMDPSTILWWLGQSDEARKGVRFGGRAIDAVLSDFTDFIKGVCRAADVRPWGNSAAFDLSKIGTAYDRLGVPRPWFWNNERCFRTVRNLNPQVEYDFKSKGDAAHNALADATFQAEHLFKIKRSKTHGA